MYLPRHFDESRPQALAELIRSHPLATLVTLSPAGLQANPVPLLLDTGPDDGPHGTLRGHVARANPLWREHDPAVEALAVFHGPDAYVSPGWYASKREHGKVVPTWNYAVVQARGPLRIVEDRAWLRDFVGRLTHRHEAHRSEPWHIDDAPAAFTEQLLGSIVGIEMPLTRLEGKWKLSQNRPVADRQGVIDGLRQEAAADAADVAAWMARLEDAARPG